MIESFVVDSPEGTSPENILVLETAGRIEDFRSAVNKIPGLVWQAEIDVDDIESDDVLFEKPKVGVRFFSKRVSGVDTKTSKEIQLSLKAKGVIDDDERLAEDVSVSDIKSAIPEEHKEFTDQIVDTISNEKAKPLTGRVYLSLSNRQAIDQVKRLFDAAQRGENPPQLTGTWKSLFSHLHEVRYWDVEDRVRETGVLDYWKREVELKKGTSSTIPFEVELSFSDDPADRARRQQSVEQLVLDEEGEVTAVCQIPEIRFHALKVELPVDRIEKFLAKDYGALFRSGGVVFFRPAAQCSIEPIAEGVLEEIGEIRRPVGEPVLALLDGMPFAHHALLEDFLVIDDPDGFAEEYEFNEFRHGTAMASLICHGELDSGGSPATRKIYVRPIMKPDDSPKRSERIPNDIFFEDILERAVRRMFEGDENGPPVAPTVKIINLSVADPDRLFHRIPGPTARLLDWLSYKYRVLFCVSAGNTRDDFVLGLTDEEFKSLKDTEKISLVLNYINSKKRNRRIFSPAESINALTVGALHDDMSPLGPEGNRLDILPDRFLPAPISTMGHGFRSSIKPEVFLPGGRQFYEYIGNGVFGISDLPQAPGQKVAGASVRHGERSRTLYTRGTSNATAMASRSAVFIYDALEQLFDNLRIDFPADKIAPLIKALLVHGASWGDALETICGCLEFSGHASKKELARFLGYGVPDIQKSIECTAHRATAIGFGSIEKDQRHEYRFPLPQGLSGLDCWRRLTITLAWISPISVDNRKYRRASLAYEATGIDKKIGGKRREAQWQQVKNGTVQHEIIEGEEVCAYLDNDQLVIPVQCREDATPLDVAIPYGLAVSLEVKEEVGVPIYEEIKESIEIVLQEQLVERIR
jgi:hypothetical protein